MFDLSPEHEAFRASVRDFAENEIAPHVAKWDRDHHFPVDVVLKMGEMGLFGLPFPEEYGGAARAATSPRCASRSRSWAGSTSRGDHAGGRGRPGRDADPHRSATRSRSRSGCPTWSPAGRWPASGSPSRAPAPTPAATRTTARLDDGEWVINGTKQFITNSGHRHHESRDGHRGHR